MNTYDVNLTALRLAGVLAHKSVTQKEACNRLGVKSATLKNYTTGKSRIPPDVLYSVSVWTGVSSDYLLGLVDEAK